MTTDERIKDKIKRLMREAHVAETRKCGEENASSSTQPANIQITGNATVGVIGNYSHVEINVSVLPDELGEVIRRFKL